MAEAHLPNVIGLSLEEAGDLLQVLDDAEGLAPIGSQVRRAITAAIRTLTHKLWPELGRLLDDDEE